MANAILFDAHPSAETLIATTGTLKNLANAAIAVSAAEAFTIAGRNYLVEYRFTPVAGQVIIVRAKWRVYKIGRRPGRLRLRLNLGGPFWAGGSVKWPRAEGNQHGMVL